MAFFLAIQQLSPINLDFLFLTESSLELPSCQVQVLPQANFCFSLGDVLLIVLPLGPMKGFDGVQDLGDRSHCLLFLLPG